MIHKKRSSKWLAAIGGLGLASIVLNYARYSHPPKRLSAESVVNVDACNLFDHSRTQSWTDGSAEYVESTFNIFQGRPFVTETLVFDSEGQFNYGFIQRRDQSLSSFDFYQRCNTYLKRLGLDSISSSLEVELLETESEVSEHTLFRAKKKVFYLTNWARQNPVSD